MTDAARETATRPIAIGSDDAGFQLKEVLRRFLEEQGYQVVDFGTHDERPVDYPDIAFDVAHAIARGDHDRGVLVCGTGIGMSIAANKVPGVFAALAHDPYSAARARMSNDAQIVTMGSRVIGPELAKVILQTWLDAEFSGGASARKVGKIHAAEERDRPAKRSPGHVPATSGGQ